ncbi:MAG: flagellar hook-basal body complex protein [Pseudomonadales bacterium]|nr:flagellar hook-basal body complex protein [Pseudomonadales bacterium]
MTFNTALSGLSAATADLRVTGNNIANAGTVGFKGSRAEFSDVYSSSLLGSGSNQIGSGVRLANVAQQFDQGNRSVTNNSLDLAIDGNGFFVISDQGAVGFTRAGMFGVNDAGFLVTNAGARVQGFGANAQGTVSGILGDLQLSSSNISPQRTSLIDASMNLDARQTVLSQIGSTVSTAGAIVGVAQAGLPSDTNSVLNTAGGPTSFDYSVDVAASVNSNNVTTPFDFSAAGASASFSVQMTGSSVPSENTTVTVTLNSNVNSLADIINDIRGELSVSGIGVDVREDPGNFGRLQFYATRSGEASAILVDPLDDGTLGANVTKADVEAAMGGIAIGVNGAGGGPGSSTTTPLANATATTGTISAASFDVILAGAALNNGTANINLTSNVNSIGALILDIRDDLVASGIGVDVREDPNNPGRLQFYAPISGEASTITVTNLDSSNPGVTNGDIVATLNLDTGVSIPGLSGVGNGYGAQAVDVVAADGTTQAVTTTAGASAAQIAGQFSSSNILGVSASAVTTATIPSAGFIDASGTMSFSLNSVNITGSNMAALAASINTTTGLGTISAEVDSAGDLVVTDQVGNDLSFAITGGTGADSISILGTQGPAATMTLAGTPAAAVGGTVEFTLDEAVTLAAPIPPNSNLFGPLSPASFVPFALNTFDPTNQDTYNAATSVTVHDSLGNPHVATMYFVKERFTPNTVGLEENRWTTYVLIDGDDVGDPNPNLTPPANLQPTRAGFNVQFNPDGSFNPTGSDPILISNWVPSDENGNQNGAAGPLNVLAGGALPIAQPLSSSNFEIRLNEMTQYGSEFSVNSVNQDGFTTGQLSGLDIDDTGILLARYTNGQNLTLGQLALADFSNVQGLKPSGDSSWVQTSSSGEPVIGAPTTGSRGVLVSGALEDSNVEISEQLVNLIIAQRNFQANARTISTADEITQTIINL